MKSNQAEVIEPETQLVPWQVSSAITPMAMVDRAVSQGASVEVVAKMMELQERWQKNQARMSFESAVAAAKAEIPVIKKNKHVGFESKRTESRTDYWHEDLGQIARTIDPILGRHKLNYRFRAKQDGAKLKVTCILAHADGYFEETELEAGNDTTGNKNAHQSVGSAATYLQRYTLKLALGLAASKDDDAQAAGADKPDTITQEQADTIRDVIEASNAPRDKFLKWAKVDRIEDLRAEFYESALAAVQKYGAKS